MTENYSISIRFNSDEKEFEMELYSIPYDDRIYIARRKVDSWGELSDADYQAMKMEVIDDFMRKSKIPSFSFTTRIPNSSTSKDDL